MCFFSMFLITRPRSFWLKPTQKTEDHKIRAVDRRCHARNTCTLHLKTQLSGRRNFFTVIARRRRKKNFVLLRSVMKVDDRIKVSNHYSKSMMLAIHAHILHTWRSYGKILNALVGESGGSLRQESHTRTVWSPKTKSEGAFCWNGRTWTLLRVMTSCFDKRSRYVFGLESKPRSSFPSNERSRQDKCIRDVDERFGWTD